MPKVPCTHNPLSVYAGLACMLLVCGTALAAEISFQKLWTKEVDSRGVRGTCENVEFSPDGSLIAAGNGQGSVLILKTSDGAETQRYTLTTNVSSRTTGEVESIAFSADGRLLAIGGNLAGIRVFRLSDKAQLKYLTQSKTCDGMAFSPNGKWFAGPAANVVNIYNVPALTLLASPRHEATSSQPSEVNSIDFTQGSDLMCSGASDAKCIIWRTSDWKPAASFTTGHSVKSCRFSPDGKLVAVGWRSRGEVHRTSDGSKVTDLNITGLRKPPSYDDPYVNIEAVAWSPDGKYLYAGGLVDGLVHVFRTADWAEVATLKAQNDHTVEYIDVFGNLLAVGGEEGCVNLYRVSYGATSVAAEVSSEVSRSATGSGMVTIDGRHVGVNGTRKARMNVYRREFIVPSSLRGAVEGSCGQSR